MRMDGAEVQPPTYVLEHWPIWEKESIHHPAPVQNFSLTEKKGGHRRKISVVDMVFLVFIGFFISTTDLESSFFEDRKVPQKIFFRWW